MFRIGEFSKMSKTTIKTLRYYDEIGLLKPEFTDKFTSYRFYTTNQLVSLHEIQSMRQIGLSIEEIKQILSGGNKMEILQSRKRELISEMNECEKQLSKINFILSGREDFLMNYQATIKQTPECIVYSKKINLKNYNELFEAIPQIGEKVSKKYPDLKCTKPEYCININLDNEYRETDINIEFCEAVNKMKPDFDDIHFKKLPPITVVSVYCKGSYDKLFEANAFAYKWIEENGYVPVGGSRDNYIDGIWNKESEDEWLTEIQIPISAKVK